MDEDLKEKIKDNRSSLVTCGTAFLITGAVLLLLIFVGGKVLKRVGFTYESGMVLALFLAATGVLIWFAGWISVKLPLKLMEGNKISRNDARILYIMMDMVIMIIGLLLMDQGTEKLTIGFMPAFLIAFAAAVLSGGEFKN